MLTGTNSYTGGTTISAGTLQLGNGGIHRHFLSGDEEVRAFQNNEFIRMHNSTLAKIGFFFRVIHSLVRGKLHTSSRGWGVALDKMFEARTAKTVGLFGTIITIGHLEKPVAARLLEMIR